MNGGRAAKRLLAVALVLSSVVTLGVYYNGAYGGGGSGRIDDRPQRAAFSRRAPGYGAADAPPGAAEWPAAAAVFNDAANDVYSPASDRDKAKRKPAAAAPVSATVDRDTCPELGLANTTIDTVSQYSRFEFQVYMSTVFYPFYRAHFCVRKTNKYFNPTTETQKIFFRNQKPIIIDSSTVFRVNIEF